jgi:hypothetical protein
VAAAGEQGRERRRWEGRKEGAEDDVPFFSKESIDVPGDAPNVPQETPHGQQGTPHEPQD